MDIPVEERMKWVSVVCVVSVVVMPILVTTVLDEANDFTVARNIEKVRPAVVHIRKGSVGGSGVLVSPDGIVVTARHISNGEPNNYVVTLDDGRVFSVRHVVEDKYNDLCFMQLDTEEVLPYVKLSRKNPSVGDGLIIGGSPLGIENFNTFSFGIVSAVNRNLANQVPYEAHKYTWYTLMQTTCPVYPGNSGGPVFNMYGGLVGIVVAGADATLNWSVPVARFYDTLDTVHRIFDELRFQKVQ